MRFLNPILENFFRSEEDRTKLVNVIIPSFIIQTTYILINFGINILLARGLGAANYGIFTYVFSIVLLLVNLSTYGLNTIVIRETSSHLATGKLGLLKGLLNWASSTVLVACLVLALLVSIFAYWLQLMPNDNYTLPMIIAAFSLPFYGLLSFYTSALRGMNKIVLSLLSDSIIRSILFFIPICIVYFFLHNMELMNMVSLNTITFLLSSIVAFALYKRSSKVSNETSVYDLPTWWPKLGSLFLLGGLLSIESHVGTIMLGYMRNAAEVGIFSASTKIAAAMYFFLTTMNLIIAPLISRYNTLNEKQKLQEMITKTMRWVMVFSLPAFLVIVGFSKFIMGHFFGKEFEQGQMALIIMASAQLISIMFGPVGNIVNMTGYEKYYTMFTFCAMIITVILNFILIPSLGYNGAAIANACGLVFWNVAMHILIRRKLGISSWIFAKKG